MKENDRIEMDTTIFSGITTEIEAGMLEMLLHKELPSAVEGLLTGTNTIQNLFLSQYDALGVFENYQNHIQEKTIKVLRNSQRALVKTDQDAAESMKKAQGSRDR